MMTNVFIHGLGQTPASWDKVIAHLPAGIPIRRPCLSAMTKGKRLTYDALYQAFEAKCNRMDMPLRLCGISLGALLALQYTSKNAQKVKALVLIAPQHKMPRLLLGIQHILFRILPQGAFGTGGFSKKEMIALTASVKQIDLTPLLHEITCPTILVCGQKDRANKTAARGLAKIIPNSSVTFVEGAGHEVNIHAPEILADLIKEAWFKQYNS